MCINLNKNKDEQKKIIIIIIIEFGIKNSENWTKIEHFEKYVFILLNKDTKIFPKQINKFSIFFIFSIYESEDVFSFDFDDFTSYSFIFFILFKLPN